MNLIGQGELLAIASSITFGFTQILVRQGIQNASPVAAALIMNSMVSIGGLLIAIYSGTLMNSTLPPILWYLAIGITGPGIARVMYYIGISRMGVSRTAGISSATPIWGVIFAIISAIIVQLWFKDFILSIIISISMVLNMIVAGLFGILIPISLKKFKVDPAIASSVFVTTITDVIGFLSFLGIGAYFFY